jgi:hypothetical protein
MERRIERVSREGSGAVMGAGVADVQIETTDRGSS